MKTQRKETQEVRIELYVKFVSALYTVFRLPVLNVHILVVSSLLSPDLSLRGASRNDAVGKFATASNARVRHILTHLRARFVSDSNATSNRKDRNNCTTSGDSGVSVVLLNTGIVRLIHLV